MSDPRSQLRALWKASGLSQAKFAASLHIPRPLSRRSLIEYLQGRSPIPTAVQRWLAQQESAVSANPHAQP